MTIIANNKCNSTHLQASSHLTLLAVPPPSEQHELEKFVVVNSKFYICILLKMAEKQTDSSSSSCSSERVSLTEGQEVAVLGHTEHTVSGELANVKRLIVSKKCQWIVDYPVSANETSFSPLQYI